MKYIAWIMVVLLVASLFGVGYVYLTATLQIESVSVIAMEAAAQPELFESLRLSAAGWSDPGNGLYRRTIRWH